LPNTLTEVGKYYILRFASLNAHHDKGRKGINDALAVKLIEILSPSGQVFITSERPFSSELEPYRLPVHPADMHHVMAHASMYIGDSQTMAAEAAVLGVPSIRFNDFVGELSYLEELEHKYGLTVGIPTSNPEKLLQVVASWTADAGLLETWSKRRTIMLRSTIDVTPLWVETFVALACRKR
jgi:predicted glycosyltransferase